MTTFITDLLNSIDISALWSQAEPIVGLIGLGILLSFGYTVLKSAVGGLGRGTTWTEADYRNDDWQI